ncbi:MAG TPA: DUF6152 family protein [Vicinamibacterales bacterium]|jgi:hypothetical protein|nr:DUF6152 family protein [Vicinamibacterales bacterium]
MNGRTIVAVAAAAVLGAGPSFAHHAWPIDRSKEVTVKGTVTAFNWSNPHVMIDLEIKTDAGKIEKWNIGGPSTERMTGNGWDRNTLKPGDVITGIGYRHSDGSNVVQLQKIVLASGREMLLYARR